MEKADIHVVFHGTDSYVASISLTLELRNGRISHIVQTQQFVRKVLDSITVIQFCIEFCGSIKTTVKAAEAEHPTTVFQTYTVERDAIVCVV